MNILVADDHTVFREGLIALLSGLPSINKIFSAQNGKEVLDLIAHHKIQVALMDLDMPIMDGLEAIIQIKSNPDNLTSVIALTMFSRTGDLLKLHDAGVDGYLLKDCSIHEIQKAITSVVEGNEYFCAAIKAPLLKALMARKKNKLKVDKSILSDREKEILKLICEEYSTEEIAKLLFLSPLTVNNHRRNILIKIGSKNIAGLVVFAIQNGIYALPENKKTD